MNVYYYYLSIIFVYKDKVEKMSDATKEEKPKTDNWAEMSDNDADDQPEENQEAKKEHTIKPAKKKVPAEQKGVKNARGDYVVSSIDIPDLRAGVKQEGNEQAEEDSDTDTEYDEEDDVNETAQVAEPVPEGK
jgi:hypothetical protein